MGFGRNIRTANFNMIYDTTKHAICENWGTPIAYFQMNVLSETAFEIVDKINENYDLRAVIDNKDEIISHLEEKVDKLESQLKDIEEYGTEEINAAVILRGELAALRVEYDQLYSDTEGK